MSARRDIIRVGDEVRIVVPKFVTRIGYPKTVDDFMPEAESRFAPRIRQMTQEIFRLGATRSEEKLIREFAYLLLKESGFGGSERSLHLHEQPEYEGATGTVAEIVTRQTGRYSPPVRGGYYGEDWEPASLGNMKAHRIASIHYVSGLKPMPRATYFKELRSWESPLRIPVYHLEKIVG